MTEENLNYRTSQMLLRNRFAGKGKFKIPVIPKFEAKDGDFDSLLLIGFDKTRLEDRNHLGRMVHFFLYDYKFERVWKSPDSDIEKLRRYRAVFSPDFSVYLEMAPVMQLYNVFRNRWCGAYWASKALRVVPTVRGDESTFDFCFEGIEKGSVVAVSTYMASAHDNRKDQKEWFLKGYAEMLRQIEPEKVICYNTPFPEMAGDIITVDYELSSWRYMSYENKSSNTDLSAYKIGGHIPSRYDTITPYLITAGGGSAFGGQWRPDPSKPNDVILRGTPDTIERHWIPTRREGYAVEVKYDHRGYAIIVRHFTDHGRPDKHTNPHDHYYQYDNPTHTPEIIKPHINYYGDFPEIKSFYGEMKMTFQYNEDALNFKTIDEFKRSIKNGGELTFEWNGIDYGIFYWEDAYVLCLLEPYGKSEWKYQTVDELLKHPFNDKILREIIKEIKVIDRII